MGARLKIILVLTSIILLNHVCWTRVGGGFVNHYTSTYVQLCQDACSMHDNDYYWCNTRKGWDYCSVCENTDYTGNECRDDHPCEKHGESYYWCHNKAGDWGYCGKLDTNLLYISSTYQSVCKDECFYDNYYLYNWCHTDSGWDYCSQIVDHTYNNEPCNLDHPCDTHGKTYTWCRTHSGWDYCGLIQNAGYNNNRQKRQPNNLELIEICRDEHNNREIGIYAEPSTDDILNGKTWRREIDEIILLWQNIALGDRPRSGLKTTKFFRIDLQGLVNRNNLRCYNLQIQRNVQRGKKISTTVAQVFLPQNKDIPDDCVQKAFQVSSNQQARVFVDVLRSVDSRSPFIRPRQYCR